MIARQSFFLCLLIGCCFLFPASSSALDEEKVCSELLPKLYFRLNTPPRRNEVRIHDTDILKAHFHSQLTFGLQVILVQAYRNYEAPEKKTKATPRERKPTTPNLQIRSSTFNPNVFFRDKEALRMIVNAFPKPDAQGVKRTDGHFHKIDEFLDTYEADYYAAGGRRSPLWREKVEPEEGAGKRSPLEGKAGPARKNFMRHLVLEMAYVHEGYESVPIDRIEKMNLVENDPLSWLAGYAEIVDLFGTEKEFHIDLLAYCRARKKGCARIGARSPDRRSQCGPKPPRENGRPFQPNPGRAREN